jgi:hypothetical protein
MFGLEIDQQLAQRKRVGVTWAHAPDLELVSFEKAGRQVTPEVSVFRDAWMGSKALRPLPKIE